MGNGGGLMSATVYRVNQGVWSWAVETAHFDVDYIEELKEQVPPRQRKWNPDAKVWLFKDDAMETVFFLLRRHFGDYQVHGGRAELTPAAAYQALHLLPSAPPELVKVAFKCLAKLNHPDKGGDTATMQAVNAAYEQLLR